ncbi:phosphoribosyltransferase [Corallococcus sp. CA053C]|uniref:phosphoribosyltransferase n=1 Tax=Corallococcus sp. CA053C TaxID=2316732 RepID=UPI000EA21D55|nr:phosphoribosyltransferase family protein [Corallococcus sp. CA053C]RKH14106.1 phosphoribosyltransferase [Corallococcus sp. CA053C]
MYFEDRIDAGRRLARLLLARGYTGEDTIVLGLPRGGVPVASEVAEALGAPLDVWVVRKVGTPHHEELGLGAVAEGGIAYLDRDLMRRVGVAEPVARRIVLRKAAEVKERVARFRGGAAPPELQGRTVILVDDGIATGGTVRAALQSLRSRRPGRIVLAVPLAGDDVLEELQPLVEDLVCVLPMPDLEAVGQAYVDFPQVPDADVVDLLARARARGQGLPLEHGA